MSEQNPNGNTTPTTPPDAKKPDFPIIGIGSSAGGLEALENFVAALPEQSGIAFVVIAHTHPKHATMLPELLKRKSKIPVMLLEDNMPLAPDTIYVPPSDRDAVVEKGVIRLYERTHTAEVHMPIDIFFNSLAEDRGERAGCVILSGTGTDGTGGLRRIKEKAGIAVAQTKESAQYTGMPTSAFETGLVDYVLSPSEMPERLIEFFRHPATIRAEPGKPEEWRQSLNKVLAFLSDRTGHDFSLYKANTMVRRIERRMSITRCRTVSDYFKYLHRHPDETRALFQDLLIGVTNFFRDPEVFDYLKEKVLPSLLQQAKAGESFRAWIAGCATGEEAYSVAIVVRECMAAMEINREMQIFATDIHPGAIERARQGIYPQNIAAEVSKERLNRFFTPEESYFRVKKEIRESVIFADQNVLRDPPFMGLDLLVCRNLLIYLEQKAQNQLLPLFHYNLKPGGILFLGTSESTGRFSELFEPVLKKYSLYRKKETGDDRQQPYIQFPAGPKRLRHLEPESESEPHRQLELPKPEDAGIDRAVKNKLLHEYTPSCVIVDHDANIVYIHGRTGKYLEHAPGKPSLKITEMAREGLRYILSAAIRRASENKTEVRENNLSIKSNGGYVHVNLVVKPLLQPPLKDFLMVLFEAVQPEKIQSGPTGETQAETAEPTGNQQGRRIAELERKLDNLRQDYISTVEELETSNEELKSLNEELYSSNEELQSSNEELESSREELESLNEELSTVNNELHNKIEEVQAAYSKITEVLNNTGIAIVFLDNNLIIRRFTNEAARLINLIDKDVGRPLDHIAHNLEYDKLTTTIRQVIEQLVPVEENVRTKDGQWYRMRIMVHRTEKNVIEGVVVTFIHIDTQKDPEQGEQLRRD